MSGDGKRALPENEPIVRSWERLFKTYYREQVSEAMLGWPSRRSFVVDFFHVQAHDEHLTDFLLGKPYEALVYAHEALKLVDIPGMELAANVSGGAGSKPRLVVRVVNLPETARMGVSAVRTEHAGRLVSISGVVQSVAPVAAKAQDVVFICSRCGNAVRVPQDEHLVLQEPIECYEDQGGCGREAKFKMVVGEHRGKGSLFVDLQALVLQEPPEGIIGTRTPARMHVFLEDDLCGVISPSDRVRVNGVVRVAERRTGNKKSTVFDFFIEANSVEREARDYDEIEPTAEEVEKFREFAASPDLRERFIGSIAPSVHGRREVKLAILAQLFGGVRKTLPDGRSIRGDIHTLLVGDPGVAKSELGKAAVRLSPRGVFANALTTTLPGVVGGVEKVERSIAGEGWVYQAGLVSMCHRGLLCLDEVDKPRDEGLHGALLEPMEQQTASLSKHGARGVLVKCEFAMFSMCNPKGGRFLKSEGDKIDQVDLPKPFLDRFDLVFLIEDAPDEEHDARLVRAMLRSHAAGNAILRGEEMPEGAPVAVEDPEFLRRYVAYAKRSVFPKLSVDAEARILAKYTMQRRRRSFESDSPVGYSPRTVNTLVRLAEAFARMRLADVVSEDDLSLAMEVYNLGWERAATNAAGQIDADRVGAAPSFDQRERMRIMKEIVASLQGADGVEGDVVVAEAMRHGIAASAAAAMFGRWKRDGTLMERGSGKWALTGSPPRRASAPTREGGADMDGRGVRWS